MKYTLRRDSPDTIDSKSNWEIRKINLEGKELVQALNAYLSRFMEGILDPDTAGKSPERYIDNLMKDRLGDFSQRCILTAYDGDKPIGILICLPDNEGEMHIYSLGTLPSYRKSGVGSSLLKACINEMLDKNIRSIVIDVHSDNIPAYNLYKKFGFK